MICDECQRRVEMKEKTIEDQFARLLEYIKNADGKGGLNYFEQCLIDAQAHKDAQGDKE